MDSRKPVTTTTRSLAVWLTLSVSVFVLVGSLALLGLVQHQVRREEAASFEALARANAAFLDRTPLPQSKQMARQLGEVMGAQVFFQKDDKLTGASPASVKLPPPDGKARWTGDSLSITRQLRNGTEVSFQRTARETPAESILNRTDTWLALGVFWSLALALAAWLARRVTRPLTQLAVAAPRIGSDESLPNLPLSRGDEIGQLARSLAETHSSLQTERERRRAAERLALLGRMATSLAHEVRNPVSAIRLHAQLLEGASVDDAAASRALIESEATRIESLVRQWMMFARPGPPVMKEFQLGELIVRTLSVVQPQAQHANVTISNQAQDRLLTGDSERIGQVLHNLFINAIQAMPRGGELTIRTTPDLVIEDQGSGFSPEALAHATEPFFSEKEGGMGLGLAVAAEICAAHGAVLSIGNRPEGGGCVTIRFSSDLSS